MDPNLQQPNDTITQPQPQPAQPLIKPYLDNDSAIIIAFLFFLYPIGVILMWFMGSHWQKWLKIILTLPIIFSIISAILFFSLFATIFSTVLQNASVQTQNSTYPDIQTDDTMQQLPSESFPTGETQ